MIKRYGQDHKLYHSLDNFGYAGFKPKYYPQEETKMVEKNTEKEMLKIKIGEFYDGKEAKPVYATAWEQESKDGKKFFSLSMPIFLNKVKG